MGALDSSVPLPLPPVKTLPLPAEGSVSNAAPDPDVLHDEGPDEHLEEPDDELEDAVDESSGEPLDESLPEELEFVEHCMGDVSSEEHPCVSVVFSHNWLWKM